MGKMLENLYIWVKWCSESLFSLVVASQYEPFEILQRLSPYLGGSASIVVYSPYVQVRSGARSWWTTAK